MMELKRIVSVGLLSGIFWLGPTEYARTQEVETEVGSEEELVPFEVVADSTVSEALVRERLAKLENIIPLRYHKVTHQFVEYFIYRKPAFVKRMLEQMHLFFPLYEQMLEKYDMPRELKFLSLIESGLNPRIISYAGAGGLWQFMPATGREYGMKQDDYIDERFDPVKSTEAACRYLKRLHNAFGDWEMALAAYNVGPGNVKRAIRRSGSHSFWGIYNFLPKQTRHYVPQFVAITYMMHYHADHGIFAETPDYPMLSDTIQISGYFNLHTFAKLSNITFDEIYKLNPQLINTELPPYVKDYVLRIPSHHTEYLQENRLAIWDSAAKSPFHTKAVLASNEEVDSDSALAIKKVGGLVAAGEENDDPEAIIARKSKKLYHTVRHGETLGKIAGRYGVDTYDLKRWNHMRSNTVMRGKKLVIYKESSKTALANLTPAKATGKIKMRYHRVQSGDTLSTIAERYGINVSRLKKINRLRGNTVRKGQKLIVG
ncbi:MAG: transglycosylase SLT domain-containing protein [Spirosomataceae bacterium]